MNSPTRREALGIMAAGGALVAAVPAAAFAEARLACPEHPLCLTRRLERSLRDGQVLVVERSWQIDFARLGQGVSISGTQLACEVEAPSSLAPIAAIEEGRSTAAMWPILLGENGTIMGSGSSIGRDELDQALRAAQQVIAGQGGGQPYREARMHYLATLQDAGAQIFEYLPHDLFYPAGAPLKDVRRVDLPGGMAGEFEIAYEATPVPGKGWLDRAVRRVETRIGDTSQSALEEWRLKAL